MPYFNWRSSPIYIWHFLISNFSSKTGTLAVIDPTKKQIKKKVPLVIHDQKMLQALGIFFNQIFYLNYNFSWIIFSNSPGILQIVFQGMENRIDGGGWEDIKCRHCQPIEKCFTASGNDQQIEGMHRWRDSKYAGGGTSKVFHVQRKIIIFFLIPSLLPPYLPSIHCHFGLKPSNSIFPGPTCLRSSNRELLWSLKLVRLLFAVYYFYNILQSFRKWWNPRV